MNFEIGRTYRFTNPALAVWGDWTVSSIEGNRVYSNTVSEGNPNGKSQSMVSMPHYAAPGELGHIEEVGPEIYEEWFK